MRPTHNDDSISLNKYIADTGFCSRREADDYIAHGRVTINDNVAIPGNRVRAGDVVEVDGELIGKKKATVYIAYHKPKGVTSTTDRRDKTNIIDAVGHSQRVFPIGRLDKDSEGLIFLTNDGNIVNKILRAGNEHEKEYVVTVDKPIDPEFVRSMAAGVYILGIRTRPCKVIQEGRNTFRITLVQGLNRQIRRMCHALGFEVSRLKRVRIMNVHLGNLASGHWRYLNGEEIEGISRMIASSSNDAPGKMQKKPASKETPRSTPAPESKAAKKSSSSHPPAHQDVKRKDTSYKSFRKRGKK
jgi:23S rRNA pseudouridine2604 synthase